ncbi:MAG: glycosyltransferase, partial [Thermoanaerobaculia bacterium]|nr:glycosyltransferase [Thermoanaerobaculia bacterium]
MPSPILLLASVVFVLWLALSLARTRQFPSERFLTPAPGRGAGDDEAAGAAADGASVAAIVPARNEADVLAAALASLLAQDHRRFSVYLVDDGSTDGSAEVARTTGTGAELPLWVESAGDKPPGWAGKVFAQSRGLAAIEAAGAAPDWLLLTDADIRHPPDSVSRLLAQAERGGYDLVSVMARLHAVSFFERLLIPTFVFFFHLLYPFREVSRRGSSTAAAAGGCVLVRTRVLRAAGGFEALRDALIDDVALGRLVKGSGGHLWLGFDPDIESIRPYDGLGDIWRMVARSAFVQLRFSYLAVAGVVL